jgi:SAM-dependent methyltransferase
MHDRQRLNDAGGARINFMLWRIKPVGYGEIDRGQYDKVVDCISCGGAMMVRADVFLQLGGFDTLFDPFGPEDLDFSLRLKESGYISRYIPLAVAYHEVSHTYGRGYSEEYARNKSRHWRTFMHRHASMGQKLGFFLLGAPYLALWTILREGRRGNLGAIRGLVRGLFDPIRFSKRRLPLKPHTQVATPWQLAMFRRSLKKQLKLKALLKVLGDTSGKECLLATCGDNNGALNWCFRENGGNWTWGDLEAENLDEISRLLDEPVYKISPQKFPFAEGQFECIVAIDVLEHLENDQLFLREVNRALKPGGRALITVPNGDPRLLANRIKQQVGMTPEVYGHTRAGYTLDELRQTVREAGLKPVAGGGYSGFFTEMVELLINAVYVKVLSRKDGAHRRGIAPTSAQELKTHGLAYRLYPLVYPFLKLVSCLDRLQQPSTHYAVIVVGRKEGGEAS